MRKYLLETSVIISFLRGKKEAIKLPEKLKGELSSSFVCLAEIYEGIHRSRERRKAEKGVLDLFAGLSEIYGLDAEIAKSFGQIRTNLKRRGQVIEDLDILLAATCLANNLTLVTYNPKHFTRVKNLKIFQEDDLEK